MGDMRTETLWVVAALFGCVAGCSLTPEEHFDLGGPTLGPGGGAAANSSTDDDDGTATTDHDDAGIATATGAATSPSDAGDDAGDGDGADPGEASTGAAIDPSQTGGDAAGSDGGGAADAGSTSGEDAPAGTTGDGIPPVAGQCAPVAVEETIASAFFDCGDDARIGQYEAADGVTCAQVCCTFGFDACVHQAGQNNPFFCTPEGAPQVGACTDAFVGGWMYQCLCA